MDDDEFLFASEEEIPMHKYEDELFEYEPFKTANKSQINLPNEIYRETLLYLEPRDLLAICSTEYYSSIICRDETFWVDYISNKYNPRFWGFSSLEEMKKDLNYNTWKEMFKEHIYQSNFINVHVIGQNNDYYITIAIHPNDYVQNLLFLVNFNIRTTERLKYKSNGFQGHYEIGVYFELPDGSKLTFFQKAKNYSITVVQKGARFSHELPDNAKLDLVPDTRSKLALFLLLVMKNKATAETITMTDSST
jgi:hypothetical protein